MANTRRNLFHFNPHYTIESKLRSILTGDRKDLDVKCFNELITKDIYSPTPFVYTCPFLTKNFCGDLIWFANLVDRYSLRHKYYPGDHAYVNDLSPYLQEVFEKSFAWYLTPIIASLYSSTEIKHLNPPHIIRVTNQFGSEDFKEHFDIFGNLTFYIPLNNTKEYVGGGIHFVELEKDPITNERLKVGTVVIYPSQLTHIHKTLPVKSGICYYLVATAKINKIAEEKLDGV